MKKTDKVDILNNSINTKSLCDCTFNYNTDSLFLYILKLSDNLLLGIEEDDFTLDGFFIRKISDLKTVEIRDNLCSKIENELNLLADVQIPKIDIISWKTVFESLKSQNRLIIVETEKSDNYNSHFHMGYVTEIKKSCIVFSEIDADGVWYKDIAIPYSDITSANFNDRYSTTWQEYIVKHNLLPD